MTPSESKTWFPDFCRLPMLFSLMIICELVVVLVELGSTTQVSVFINELSISTLFVQWLAILIALMLCTLRGHLSKLPIMPALCIAYALVLLLTALVTWLAINFSDLIGVESNIPIDSTAIIGRNVLIASLVALATSRYFYIQQRWKLQVESLAEAEVKTLQARIRPHFLFNSMNTIASLIHSKPDVAEQCVEDLSELFRAALNTLDKKTTLGNELTLCQQYLQIESLRLGDRLQLDWQLSEPIPDILLPPLTLQPLFENAIYHGISQLAHAGVVTVSAVQTSSEWSLTIINPVPRQNVTDHNSGHQLALDNIKQRLEHWFDKRAQLETHLLEDSFQATIRLPIN